MNSIIIINIIFFYNKLTQIILTFWLVLSYDLLEDRCMIDLIHVITYLRFSLCVLK